MSINCETQTKGLIMAAMKKVKGKSGGGKKKC